jgi:soluble lytic murein transglycosylase-like protein
LHALDYSIYRTAPLTIAEIFGRSQPCANADIDLIETTARASIDNDLDPGIAAATIAVESGCNQYAISTRGAIGYMQIVPKVWKDQYDLAGSDNLLNEVDNIRTGTKIMQSLIDQYGTVSGIQHYNGMGADCLACDPDYSSKILALARQ